MSHSSDSKPSVLFINRVFPPDHGASGRMVRDLSLAFAKDGWHVNVICASNTKGIERHKNVDIRVHKVKAPLKSKTIFRYIKIWRRIYRAGMKLPAHDLVISMTDPPMMVVGAARIARKKNSAHMHWCQDLYPELAPVLGVKIPSLMVKFLKRLSGKAMKSCDRIVVIGRDMARYLIALGIDGQKISFIPNWPNIELVRPPGSYHGEKGGQESSDTTRQNTTLYEPEIRPLKNGQEPIINLFKDKNNPRFRILYAGSIGRAHPIDPIIDAATILNETNPEIEFVFVGDGAGFEEIAKKRAYRDLQNIRLIPSQPANRLRELMESGDVHIISMIEECAGLLVPSKLYSALAVARPTIFIGPENSEVAKVLRDFKAGTVIPQDDTTRLVEAIKNYRYDSDAWFNAQNGAAEAGQIFVPRESMIAWLKRARAILKQREGKL